MLGHKNKFHLNVNFHNVVLTSSTPSTVTIAMFYSFSILTTDSAVECFQPIFPPPVFFDISDMRGTSAYLVSRVKTSAVACCQSAFAIARLLGHS